MAEAALALPLVVILVLGILQVSLLSYGAMMARFAVFSALRSVATARGADIQPLAAAAARRIISSAPGLVMAGAVLREAAIPLRGAAMSARRCTLTILVRVPRVIPSRRIILLDTVSASASMPMEPPR